jgi:hypothetical protein
MLLPYPLILMASDSTWWKCRVLVDEGTSVLVDAQVGADFHAETTLEAVADLFVRHGLPEAVRMDRDVRFVSSPSGSDFPSALVRF